jgi:hypothetical protein
MENPNHTAIPAAEAPMSATIVLNRGSAGVWQGLMVVRKGDKVTEFGNDSPKVAQVLLNLATTLVGVESGSKIILPGGPLCPLVPKQH